MLPELVRKATAVSWERFVRKGGRVAFRVTCRKSRLYHSDAVAERLHAALEARVGFSVNIAQDDQEEGRSDVQLFLARFDRDLCTVSVDTSGALLHQRGWRGPQARAPLRETLAAALLLAGGFRGEEPVCDPLCGSGTIAIEAGLIAIGRAPGVDRRFAFQRWPEYSARQWEHLVSQARKRERPIACRIEASDEEAGAIAATQHNAARAGVEIAIAQRRLADLPSDRGVGLLATNPPYGVRVGGDLDRISRELSETLKRRPLWRSVIIAPRVGTPAGFVSILRTQNGGIPVEMLAFPAATPT